VVKGDLRGVGDYVVWICRVDMIDGGHVVFRKRYSEFEALRNQLAATFPRAASSLPPLPPKSVICALYLECATGSDSRQTSSARRFWKRGGLV